MLESKCPLPLSSLPAKELCPAIKWLFHTLSRLHPWTLPAFISPLTRALNSLWNWKREEKQIIFTHSNLPACLAHVCSAQLPVTNFSSLTVDSLLWGPLPPWIWGLCSLSHPCSFLLPQFPSHWSFSPYPEVQLPSQEKGCSRGPFIYCCFFASLKGLFPKRPGSTCSLRFPWSGGLASLLRLGFLDPPHPPTHSRYWQAPLARSSHEFSALFLTFQQCRTQWPHCSSGSSFFFWLLRCDFCIFLLLFWGFPGGSEGKASACNAGDLGSISGLGRSPGEGNGHLPGTLAWRIPCTEEPGVSSIHGVSKSQTGLSNFTLTLFLSLGPLCWLNLSSACRFWAPQGPSPQLFYF